MNSQEHDLHARRSDRPKAEYAREQLVRGDLSFLHTGLDFDLVA